jgi:predicted amidophosphoribosyltransferase
MVDVTQLRGYTFKDYADKGQTLLLMEGEDVDHYYTIIQRVMKPCRFSRLFPDQYRSNSWGTYIYNLDSEKREKLDTFLRLLRTSVYIADNLDQTFALDYHYLMGRSRTNIGELVYKSKPYNRRPQQANRDNANTLSIHFEAFINAHPAYRDVDYLVSVPASKTKTFDLPAYIAQLLCNRLDIRNGQAYLSKIKETKSMKDLTTVEEKIENIRGAFAVTNDHPFAGCTVMVIDDIYQSGVTLHEVGATLQEAGAHVVGLVATKTFSNVR